MLGRQVMEMASLPGREDRRLMRRPLNRLEWVRPMVWLNGLSWPELACEELECRCEDEFCRRIKARLRTMLCLWRHMRCDMVVDGVYTATLGNPTPVSG